MTRNKVFTLLLAVAIILSIAVAPLSALPAFHSGLATHVVLASTNVFSIGVRALPVQLACDGCSAGGGGPV
jgi:hypothetical protein